MIFDSISLLLIF